MGEIALTQGYVALVDDEDFEELNQYSWHISQNKHLIYAIRNHPVYPNYRITVKMHRQVIRAQNGEIVDHINGNGLDNRKENLRIVTGSQNCANKRAWVGRTSKYKGVSWHKQHSKWYVSIYANKKHVFLGLYDDEIKAAKAYDRKALEIFGEFAKTNFPAQEVLRI